MNNDDEAADPDDFVICISENKYQIGGVLFDEEACTLTFEDRSVVKCPMQSYKLLSAFVHAKNVISYRITGLLKFVVGA